MSSGETNYTFGAELAVAMTAPLCVAGVALGWLTSPGRRGTSFHHLDVTWQAWHLVTSTFVLRGRRGTDSHTPSFCVAGVALLMALRGALALGFVACDARGAAPRCVAGVALGDIHLPITSTACPFAYQAWNLVTSTFGITWQSSHGRHARRFLKMSVWICRVR